MKVCQGFPEVEGVILTIIDSKHASYTMKSGSTYTVFNTQKEYVNQEYPEGGFVVHSVRSEDQRDYIDHSPDIETLYCFVKALNQKKGFYEYQ